ncbi:MAG: glutamine--fructose-6-phosphate transaminase (isomerizing) [Parvularculaceae bacterium]|nr:glutamine--fructose-6-phosphate transaminase (isomerizing) [Parvularculaceae bacterium]
MCGIIGVLGKSDVAPLIVKGLKRLEYRGYDSAGVATLEGGRLDRRRAPGKLQELEGVLAARPLKGAIGIGHTRWATHGVVSERNAHPHMTSRLALVHNGIIENFAELRRELKAKGYVFESETDTEVVAQLITHHLDEQNLSPQDAFARALSQLRGAFALAVLFAGDDDLLIGARRGPPLAVGRGDGEMFIGSDAYALAPFSNRITYLEDGDWVIATRSGFEVRDASGAKVERREVVSSASDAMVDKNGHRHYMSKEIHQQPEVIAHTLSRYLNPATQTVDLPAGAFDFAKLDRLIMSACGTAYYAALTAKYWFEQLAGLSVEVDIASELRYRHVPYRPGGGALFVSQSGETADTLAALREAKRNGQMIAAVVNVPESSIARESDVIYPMAAGPEIGVASTKAFTCQLTALACVAIAAGRQRGRISAEEERRLVGALLEMPRHVSEALKQADAIEAIAQEFLKASDVLYIGRGVCFPLALEGALKLKEVSYIHAEGYAAGELKHGPIALIDENLPVVVIAPHDSLFEKTVSNMHEVRARGGKALLISDAAGLRAASEGVWKTIEMPTVEALFSPIVYAAPVQLLAYYTATLKGTDVDQPRNLAKSVTVE